MPCCLVSRGTPQIRHGERKTRFTVQTAPSRCLHLICSARLRQNYNTMSLRSLESSVCLELRRITKRPKLRVKDIMEWSTSEAIVRRNATESEEVHHCPLNGVWAAIEKKPNTKDQATDGARDENQHSKSK